MAELVPSVDLKKADGSPLKVNFFFENGLPVKPLIVVKRKIGIDENGQYVITLMVDNHKDINSFKINNISYQNTANSDVNEIWVHLKDYYLIVPNIKKVILKEMLQQKILFQFVDSTEKEINHVD